MSDVLSQTWLTIISVDLHTMHLCLSSQQFRAHLPSRVLRAVLELQGSTGAHSGLSGFWGP